MRYLKNGTMRYLKNWNKLSSSYTVKPVHNNHLIGKIAIIGGLLSPYENERNAESSKVSLLHHPTQHQATTCLKNTND